LVKLLDVLIVDDDVEKACSLARMLRSRHFVRIASRSATAILTK